MKWEQKVKVETAEYICWVKRIDGVVAQKQLVSELIRCKDCKHCLDFCRVVDGVTTDYACALKKDIDGCQYRVEGEDFCSWAVRKE